MHLIAISKLRRDAARYPNVSEAIEAWYKIVKVAQWQNLAEVRRLFPTADNVGSFTVFNIKGNQYRLIVDIQYQTQLIYYKYFLTHGEYDKNNWKNDPYFG
ncbi:MAG: type II toxin-antitoxin system HigB family toxin [Spirulinaceae cyanobacterium]